jgi:hypothetical protein
MLILIGLTLLLIAGIIWKHTHKSRSIYDVDVIGDLLFICAGIGFCVVLIAFQ